MNKRFLTGLMVAVCIIPVAASALTADEVQAKIQALMGQVAELTKQLNTLRESKPILDAFGGATVVTPSGTTPNAYGLKYRICSMLDQTIAQGQTGDGVKGLQEFLKGRGFLNAEATGFFGTLTKDALIRWQAAEGVVAAPTAYTAGAGLFGPKSKERLRIWCGDGIPGQQFTATPTRGDAPLVVSFNTWLSGFHINTVSYTIDYGDGSNERAADCPAPADACTGPGVNSHTYSSNGTYTATLNKITDPCPDDGDPNTPRCLAAIHSEVIGKLQITVGPIACTKEYKPVCGSKPIVCITTPCNPIPTTYGNTCEMTADNATLLYQGQCRTENPADDPQCKAWFDGCNSCARNNPGDPAACTLKYCAPDWTAKAYCTARFDTTAGSAPTISAFSGPTTLKEDEVGTWKLSAKAVEGSTLSYQVWWGDENVYAPSYTTAAGAQEFTQSTTFTHAYSISGTYTVMITVRDNRGREAKTSMTVKVATGITDTVCGTSYISNSSYAPVCGRPAGCANTCEPGRWTCTTECQLHDPVTYSNRCYLDAAKAEYLYAGQCR